jgi:hypothetical protein
VRLCSLNTLCASMLRLLLDAHTMAYRSLLGIVRACVRVCVCACGAAAAAAAACATSSNSARRGRALRCVSRHTAACGRPAGALLLLLLLLPVVAAVERHCYVVLWRQAEQRALVACASRFRWRENAAAGAQ